MKVKVSNTKIGFQNESYIFTVRDINKLENMAKKLTKELGSFYSKFNIDYDNMKMNIFYYTDKTTRVEKTFKIELI